MSMSTGFIISLEDEVDFYQIKRFIQSLPNVRLIYCTQNRNEHLFIKTEFELAELNANSNRDQRGRDIE